MDVSPFLKLMTERNASDLFFSVGAPPNIKIEGKILPIGQNLLQSQQMAEIANSLMTDAQRKEFEATMELNIAISLPNLGRFRVNFSRQRGEVAIVVRFIKGYIPSIEELQLPKILESLIKELRGLILVVGATSSGKSTTLAAMIDYRNQNFHGHILTIEDPIEYLHRHKKSIVDQREVGLDTLSYENALKNAMRATPDLILIGEIRERETMKHAIAYAETGHLCLSTLHASNANQALERIINFFAQEARLQLLLDLSLNLKAIVSLRLIPGMENTRIPAVEILINTPYVADLIEKGKIEEIKEAMTKGREYGMQTFDQSIFELYKQGKISKENAVHYADSKNNLNLEIRLTEGHKSQEKLSIQADDLDKLI